jgi:hypothetical protein
MRRVVAGGGGGVERLLLLRFKKIKKHLGIAVLVIS